MSFFPYETISDFFEAEGDFAENLDDERDFEEEAFNQALLDEARAEAEQEHWEEDPEYVAMYFPGPEQDVDPPF